MGEQFTDVATISATLRRARAEGLGVPETAIRRWVKDGTLPAVFVGNKALIFYPNLRRLLERGTAADAAEV